MTASEKTFYNIMKNKGKTVLFVGAGVNRKTFRTSRHSYTPDFYDPADNIFYEVKSSVDGYIKHQTRFRHFKRIFPNVTLRVVTPTGRSWGALCQTPKRKRFLFASYDAGFNVAMDRVLRSLYVIPEDSFTKEGVLELIECIAMKKKP